MMTRAEVEAILAGTKGVTPGPWVPIHNADQHGMIRSEVRQQDDDPTNKHHWPFRVAQTVAGQFANADRANFDYLARLDPQTVSALCTSLLSHMDRVKELEGAATELIELLDDYMVVTSLTANDRYAAALERLRAARRALAQGGSDGGR